MFPRVYTAAAIENVPKMELAALQIPATSLPRLFRLPLPNVNERLLAQVVQHCLVLCHAQCDAPQGSLYVGFIYEHRKFWAKYDYHLESEVDVGLW